MPSPGASVESRFSVAAGFLELIVETLQQLDYSARAQFLRGFFRSLTRLELSEEKSVQLWDEILQRQQSLSASSQQKISLQTALVDVFSSAGLFNFPLLIEREELKRLELNAVTDPLTGLNNRRLFQETLDRELDRAKRYAHPLSLVALDLHRFKEVNDQLGHTRGDDVLKAVASTLRKSLRTSDFAFRVGGDEFSVILPQTDAPQALALSKRISVVFSEILQTLDISVPVSMDHGTSTFPIDGETAEQLIQRADKQLYRLKHSNHDNPQEAKDRESLISERATTESFQQIAVVPAPISPATKTEIPPQPREQARSLQSQGGSLAAAVSAASSASPYSATSASPDIAERRTYAVQRKAERVSMIGTNAYAVVESASRRAKVLDLGFGGVALELESSQNLPESFIAVLHVPILPPVRVNLKPVWSRATAEGNTRVGCCFVS